MGRIAAIILFCVGAALAMAKDDCSDKVWAESHKTECPHGQVTDEGTPIRSEADKIAADNRTKLKQKFMKENFPLFSDEDVAKATAKVEAKDDESGTALGEMMGSILFAEKEKFSEKLATNEFDPICKIDDSKAFCERLLWTAGLELRAKNDLLNASASLPPMVNGKEDDEKIKTWKDALREKLKEAAKKIEKPTVAEGFNISYIESRIQKLMDSVRWKQAQEKMKAAKDGKEFEAAQKEMEARKFDRQTNQNYALSQYSQDRINGKTGGDEASKTAAMERAGGALLASGSVDKDGNIFAPVQVTKDGKTSYADLFLGKLGDPTKITGQSKWISQALANEKKKPFDGGSVAPPPADWKPKDPPPPKYQASRPAEGQPYELANYTAPPPTTEPPPKENTVYKSLTAEKKKAVEDVWKSEEVKASCVQCHDKKGAEFIAATGAIKGKTLQYSSDEELAKLAEKGGDMTFIFTKDPKGLKATYTAYTEGKKLDEATINKLRATFGYGAMD